MKKIYYFLIAFLGELIYWFPSKKIKMIGVTGTDGKTTTTHLIDSILKKAGKKTMLVNGEVFRINNTEQENKTNNSTPGRFVLRKMLAQAVKEKLDYAVIEVTSIGLIQYRLWGMAFDVAVITNLTPEHLDIHKTMDNYKKAKGILFKQLQSFKKQGTSKVAVVNKDDKYFEYFNSFSADKKYTYGIDTLEADLYADNIQMTTKGLVFDIKYQEESITISLPLISKGNIYNALSACAVALSQGIELDIIKQGLESVLQVEGRFEVIDVGQPFKVIVDYAHTQNAFLNIFEHARHLIGNGRIIAVFGSAGGRDKVKRPILGEVSAKNVDFTILTTDDPRFEDPEQIIEEIVQGFKKTDKKEQVDFIRVPDRYWAIEKALEMSNPEDIVLILGMGGAGMYVKGKKINWDDRAVVREILSKKYGNK